MQTVMAKIVEWGKELPYWEQVALDQIISGEEFTEDNYQTLLQLLLEDEGLAEKSCARSVPHFYQRTSAPVTEGCKTRLKKIANLKNINALAENQELTFNPVLTVVYGENGSGKSGYARVLGSAGFTRGDREVLPDITRPNSGKAALTAEIEIISNDVVSTIQHRMDRPCPQLSSFYVFDSTSVQAHMSGKNEFSFSPAGLAYLKQLSDVTDQVRSRLAKKVEDCCQPCEYSAVFQGNSEVNRIISTLNPQTDIKRLNELATLSDIEKKLRSELAIEIANAALDKVKEQIEKLNKHVQVLENLAAQLIQADEQLSDVHIEEINQTIRHHERCLHAVNLLDKNYFQNDQLPVVGTPNWQRFLEAAQDWSNDKVGNKYPKEGDPCLLCQQPLSKEASRLILQMWEYLKGDAQLALVESGKSLKKDQQALSNLGLFRMELELPLLYQVITDYNPQLQRDIEALIAGYQTRLTTITKALSDVQPGKCQPLDTACLYALKKLIEDLKTKLKAIEEMDVQERVDRLENEKRELDHRFLLGPLFEKIKEHVEKLKWAQAARTVGGTTHHITTKHNQLFKELVTDEYIRLFEKTLADMGRPLKVKISTPGQKGKTLRQIILEASADSNARPDKVLSEGEKRAVALADFLTEVELDSTSNGIILDDPVTSLDLEWRETIAKMLVEKSKDRQVVIFTHDLPFLYYIKEFAKDDEISISTHWIKRGGDDGRPGYVYLDNSPALERDYRKATKAREIHAQALQADAAHQEFLLRDGFGALRTTYEAFIIFDLLNEVVMRFSERISFGRLSKIYWEPSIVKDVIESCERLSRNLEGHLHSDALGAVKPKPTDLLREIEHFEDLQKRLSKLKTQAGKKA